MTAARPPVKTPSRWGAVAFAAAVVIAVAVWIASGGGISERARRPLPYVQGSNAPPPGPAVTVRVAESKAAIYQAAITVTGWTRASRIVEIRSEVRGRVARLPVAKGEAVKAGTVIARLRNAALEPRRLEAVAAVKRWELELESISRLADQGYNARNNLANAEAELAAARATLAIAAKAIEDTTIAAPFAGVLNRRAAEVGALVAAGDAIGVVADLDPIVVEARITQRDRGVLNGNETASVRFLDGSVREGRVRFLSAVADPRTRTFAVEVALENPDHRLVDGLTVELTLPTVAVAAHAVPSSVITLDGAGRLGVKLLSADGQVGFVPVQVVGQDPRATLVTGLPETCKVVVAGQDFVHDGERVTSEDIGPLRALLPAGG